MEDKDNLARRVERLESLVESLTVQVEKVISKEPLRTQPTPTTGTIPPPPPPVVEKSAVVYKPEPRSTLPPPAAPVSTEPKPSSFNFPDHMKKSEYWLNKIGITLLLFGAVFLFKYSVDQGWLTPVIRVVFGMALGLTLSIIGLRLFKKRKQFSQVLLGGSIATFYITGYSAFQLFHLVPYTAAFEFFVAVTLYSFFLALKQNEFIFSLIAIIGGLGTPFLLHTGESSTPGLMIYLCILLAGASGVYFFKGWWSFFWTTCVGGMTVIQLAIFNKDSMTYAEMLDKVSIEIALFLALPFFWIVPLAREIVAKKVPEMVNAKPPETGQSSPAAAKPNHAEINVNVLTVIIPFIALGLSVVVWDWSDNIWGTISLSMALVIGNAGWLLHSKTDFKSFAYTHFIVGLALLTVSLLFFLEGDVLFAAITLQAIAIHLIRIKVGSRPLTPVAHVLFGMVTLTLFARLMEHQQGTIIFNSRALADLLVPVSAFGLLRIFQKIDEKRIYLLIGFLGLAGITLRELDSNLEFFVIAVEALVLLYVSSRMNDRGLLTAAHMFGAITAAWLIYRLFNSSVGSPVFNEKALVDIFVIAMIAGATFILKEKDVRQFYFLTAHIAFLAWFLRELSSLDNGQGIVSIAWGIYTVGLFVAGLRQDLNFISKTAMVTLLILIGKLFLVDLADIETIWRVLIFLGFGTVLLFLSYYFRSIWRKRKG